jgi:hypothetical protein
MKFWKIEGYDSLTKIYEKELKSGCFSEKKIQALLQSLVAKAGLDFDEIVGAYAKRKTKIANDLLLVQRDGTSSRLVCGDNPYFTARVIEK